MFTECLIDIFVSTDLGAHTSHTSKSNVSSTSDIALEESPCFICRWLFCHGLRTRIILCSV